MSWYFARNLLSVAVLLMLIAGCRIGRANEMPMPLDAQAQYPPLAEFAREVPPVPVDFTPQAPQYPLPLDLSGVYIAEGLEDIAEEFTWRPVVSKNGFAVIPYGITDIVAPYERLKDEEVPLFLTSDTLLHLYHIQFDGALKGLEEKVLIPQLTALVKALTDKFKAIADQTDGDIQDAAVGDLAFLTVGGRLLDPNFPTDGRVRSTVEQELANIEAHSGFQESPLFEYKEDYTQYIARGHYTRSEALTRYFKAMMWFGRMVFLMNEGIVPAEKARELTLQAALLAWALPHTQVGQASAADIWSRIYAVTAFFSGQSDDITADQYFIALKTALGDTGDVSSINDQADYDKFHAEIAKLEPPKIYGGTGRQETQSLTLSEEELQKILDETKGMRFMGQRFIVDSFVFQRLVNLKAINGGGPFTVVTSELGLSRGFPRGLDLMSILSSDLAGQLLRELKDDQYEEYWERNQALKQDVASWPETYWYQSLNRAWLYSLPPLWEATTEGYPTFMQTEAWETKQLTTALASWAQLRHDTILYAKQSYEVGVTMAPMPEEPPAGFVEPVPDFYARLLRTVRVSTRGLEMLGAAQQVARLQSLDEILVKAIELSEKELTGQPLGEYDNEWISDLPERLTYVGQGEEADTTTEIIADVHTSITASEVLEEATGPVDLAIVAFPMPGGRVSLAAGPTLSYFEFRHPMSDRLTDEKWQQMLQQGGAPNRPPWVAEYWAGAAIGE